MAGSQYTKCRSLELPDVRDEKGSASAHLLCILKGTLIVPLTGLRGRSVRVQNMVLRVDGNSIRV
jgi:hypothetical protein